MEKKTRSICLLPARRPALSADGMIPYQRDSKDSITGADLKSTLIEMTEYKANIKKSVATRSIFCLAGFVFVAMDVSPSPLVEKDALTAVEAWAACCCLPQSGATDLKFLLRNLLLLWTARLFYVWVGASGFMTLASVKMV